MAPNLPQSPGILRRPLQARAWLAMWLGCALCAPALVGCDDDAQEEAEVSSAPIVGLMELPVSQRSTGAAPSGAAKIEVSPSELRLDGKPVLTLNGGRAAAGERSGQGLSKLVQGLKSGASRDSAALELHAQVPYQTLALVIGSAAEAGVRKLAFKVRKPGGAAEAGWLRIDHVQAVAPAGDAEVEIAGVSPRPWSDFVEVWDAALAGCRSAATGSCGYKPEEIAEGGNLQVVLGARGDGLSLRFERVGAPAPEAEPAKTAAVEMLDGVGRADPVADVENAPPVTHAEFQFRSREAVSEGNPVADAMKPVCGTRACGVVVRADPAALTVRVVSLIGAAFPDGTPAPSLAFEVPAE